MLGDLQLVLPLLLFPIIPCLAEEPCSQIGLFEDVNDFRGYYRCDGIAKTHHQCPVGTTFDVNGLPCAEEAPCSRAGVFKDVNDVRRYYRCDGSVKTHHQCPRGTTFDVNELPCAKEDSKNELQESTEEELKIVCYYTSWGIYRDGSAKFSPEDIDPFLCTHIIYAFATLDEKSFEITPDDQWADISLGCYKKVIKIKKKNPKVRVLLAIGGWTDSKGYKYSKLVSNPQLRKQFINQAISFLKEYGFDGLDLDWEYPVCWQANCNMGPTSDKENFSDFVKELRTAFDNVKPPLLLSAAVSSSKFIANNAYEAKFLGMYLHFVNVMAYDYSPPEGKTGHHATFRVPSECSQNNDNVVNSMEYWLEHGVPKSKLILGIPGYGRSFTLVNANDHGLCAPTSGPGEAGRYTKTNGSLSYSEILEKMRNRGWTMERDPNVGPYAYGEGQWVGFEDPVSCRMKARFVKSSGYGGVMVWEIATDDFNATWGERKYPLIGSLKEGFAD